MVPEVRAAMRHLQPALGDPSIVKVLHGCVNDIRWLATNFHLYLVNVFDTGEAARVLKLASLSLSHLLWQHFGVSVDKALQLADWRQRPLPAHMLEYGTHVWLCV